MCAAAAIVATAVALPRAAALLLVARAIVLPLVLPEEALMVLERHPPELVLLEPADERRMVLAMLFSS